VLSPRFRFRHLEAVRFRDLDALGHVNNAVFLTYFESARIAYWLHTTRRQGLGALDMVLARAEIDYRSPLKYGESVEMSVGCTSIGRSSFVLEADMHERGSGRLVAESRKVLVSYDYAAGRSRPLPEDVRRLILEQDPEARPA
jgi:acyl-CoA thioester hydrolase